MKINKFSTITLSIIFLSTTINGAQARIATTFAQSSLVASVLAVPSSIITTGITQHNQTKAAVFQTELRVKAEAGDQLAQLQLDTFNKAYNLNSLTTYLPVTLSAGATAEGIALAIIRNKFQSKLNMPLVMAMGTTSIVATGAASIGAAVYDYLQIKKAMKAANEITPENLSLWAEKAKENADAAEKVAAKFKK